MIKHTKINNIPYKANLNLGLCSQEHAPVSGLVSAALVNLDGCSVHDMANVVTELDV